MQDGLSPLAAAGEQQSCVFAGQQLWPFLSCLGPTSTVPVTFTRVIPRVNLEEEEERAAFCEQLRWCTDRRVGCSSSRYFSSARCVFQAASARARALTSRSPSEWSFRSSPRPRCPAARGAASRGSSGARPARSAGRPAEGCGSRTAADGTQRSLLPRSPRRCVTGTGARDGRALWPPP